MIGETEDMRVFHSFNVQLGKARNLVHNPMKKKLAKAKKAHADDVEDEEIPQTTEALQKMLSSKTPNLVKDSLLGIAPQRVRLMRVAPAPLPGQAPTIWASKKEGEIELHMLRGVIESREMAQLVELPERKAREFMEKIKARWQISGSSYDVKRGRGEALAYLGLLKGTLWEEVTAKVKDKGNPGQKVHRNKAEVRTYCLALLTRLFGTQLMLEGVTQDAVEDLSRAADESGEVMQRMANQKALGGVAGKLLDIIGAIRQQKQYAHGPAMAPPRKPSRPAPTPSRNSAPAKKRIINER